MRLTFPVVTLLALLSSSLAATGQEITLQLRSKTAALTPEEQGVVEKVLAGKLDALAKAVAKTSLSPSEQTRQRTQLADGRADVLRDLQGASPSFRKAYLDALAKKAPELVTDQEPRVGIQVLMVMWEINDPEFLETYRQLLDRKDPATLFWVVKGLHRLRDRIPDPSLASIDGRLVELAQSGDDVLREEIYGFLDQPDKAPSRAGLVKLFLARAAACAKEPRGATVSDRVLTDAVGKAYGRLTEAEQKQVLEGLARLFAAVTADFLDAAPTGELADFRVRQALLVYVAEGTLARITGQLADRPVSTALQAADRAQAEAGLTKWIGNDQQKGLLTSPPYSLPPIATTRPATAPATQPAGK